MRFLVFCLLLAISGWSSADCIPALQQLPAALCEQLGHHPGKAPAGASCCPTSIALPASQASPDRCCQAPDSSQNAVPAAQQSGIAHTPCCMDSVALLIPPPIGSALSPPQRTRLHRPAIFDLKMDMRI